MEANAYSLQRKRRVDALEACEGATGCGTWNRDLETDALYPDTGTELPHYPPFFEEETEMKEMKRVHDE